MDDRFHTHRKVLRLRRSKHYPTAVAVWTLALSWCCAQEQERFTGEVPHDVVATFGLQDWEDGVTALTEAGLFERLDDDLSRFHDWTDWNGIAGKEYRSKEQARLRQQAFRKKKCDDGKHDRHCPAETCPKKNKAPSNGGSRDPGSGRVGSGRVETGSSKSEAAHDAEPDLMTGEVPFEPGDPWYSQPSRPSASERPVCSVTGCTQSLIGFEVDWGMCAPHHRELAA